MCTALVVVKDCLGLCTLHFQVLSGKFIFAVCVFFFDKHFQGLILFTKQKHNSTLVIYFLKFNVYERYFLVQSLFCCEFSENHNV